MRDSTAALSPPLQTDIAGIALTPSYPGAEPCSSLGATSGAEGNALREAPEGTRTSVGSWYEDAWLAKDLAFSACCTGGDVMSCAPKLVCSSASASSSASPNASAGNESRHCNTTYSPPGYCPTNSGLHEICYRRRNGSYTSTGVPVDLRPPTNSPVAFLRVNGIDAPRRATLPFSVAGNMIEYHLYSTAPSDQDFFLFTRGLCSAYDGVDRMGYRKIRTHRLPSHNTSGFLVQEDVDSLVGPLYPKLFPDKPYTVCYSSTGPTGPYEDTRLEVFAFSECIQMYIKGLTIHDGRHLTVPKIGGLVVELKTAGEYRQGKFYQTFFRAGDTISLISAASNCNNPHDNPIALASTSSGHLSVPYSNGSVPLERALLTLSDNSYQICFRIATSKVFQSTNLRIDVVDALVLDLRIEGQLSPSRCDEEIATLDVTLRTREGTRITYFDHSLISTQLFRCVSDCGVLSSISSCSLPCTNWVRERARESERESIFARNRVQYKRGLYVFSHV
jgi:hypothetical protein